MDYLKSNPKTLKERDIVKQCKMFLEFHGWRAIRMQRTVVSGQFQCGEPGIPDFLFLRYPCPNSNVSNVMWIEFKSKAGKLSDKQAEWHFKERIRGATIWVVDDFDVFRQQYEENYG